MVPNIYAMRTVLTLGALFMALFCLNASAETPGHHSRPPSGIGRILPFALFSVELSSEQLSSVQAIVNAQQDTLNMLLSEESAQRIELDGVINRDAVDETAVRDASRNLAAITEEIYVLKANVVSQIRAVLTSDQKNQLDSIQNLRRLSDYRLASLPAPQSTASPKDNSSEE